MKKISLAFFLFILLLLPARGFCATRLLHEDFENTNWQTNFRSGTSNVGRVTNHSHGGSYCIRGNLKEGVIDPIVNVAGEGNTIVEFDGNEIIANQAAQGGVYVSYWRRFDIFNWDTGTYGAGKGEYITDATYGTGGLYTRMWFLPNNFELSMNGAYSSWYYEPANWGYGKCEMSSDVNPGGADGKWHKIAFYFNNTSHYMQVWFDGKIMTATDEGTGNCAKYGTQIGLPPAFVMRGLQFLYVNVDQSSLAANGGVENEYAMGYQIDDIEVWDGIPELAVSVLSAPSGLTVN